MRRTCLNASVRLALDHWLLAVVATGTASSALAQQDRETEEIVVTGSRIRQDGFESATPTTVVGSELLNSMGIANVGDAVGLIPQNSQFVSDTNVGNGNFNVGAQLANLRGLNPFFGTRTLTLLNTRRHVPTTTGGAVDLSLIPSTLVSRVETVTGGASAAYGSDAIAGVVNILLDTDLEGVKLNLDYAQTGEGDGSDVHLGVGGGWSFANDRGHVLIGGEYQDTSSIDNCTSRSWCTNADALFTNNSYLLNNGSPQYVIGPNAKLNGATQTGVIGGGFSGIAPAQFNEAGNGLAPFANGQFGGNFSANGYRQGGDGTNVGPYNYRQLRPANERYSILGHLTYNLTDRLELFSELSYASTDAVSKSALNDNPGAFLGSTIYADNFYLNQLAAPPVVGPFGLPFAREMSNLRQGRNETSNDVRRIVLGLSGDLLQEWTWETYYQYGENENKQRVHNWMVNDNDGVFTGTTNGGPLGVGSFDFFDWALDAVNDGTGRPVCRQVLLGNPAAAGCLPLNLFGLNNADQRAIDYAYRTLIEDGTFEQQVIAASFQGALFEGWGAGPISMAAGIEYRKEQGAVVHGDDPFRFQYVLSYGGDYSGALEVTEEFVEFDVPVVNGAQALNFNVAARHTENKTKGGDTGISTTIGQTRSVDFDTWKVSGVYDPVEWFRLRGTRSRDIRAAAFRELYFSYDGTLAAVGTVVNPWTGNPQDPSRTVLGGNFGLQPETADTDTFGFVISPGGADARLRFSADWYEIELEDAIATFGVGANAIIAGCFANASSPSCANIAGIPNGSGGFSDIQTVYNLAANLGAVETRGVDIETTYTWMLDQSASTLTLRVLATNLYDMIIDPGTGAPPVNYRGQSGPVGAFGGFNTSPEWQASTFLTFSDDRFSTTLQAQYVGSAKFATVFGGGFGGPIVPATGPEEPNYATTLPGSVSDNTVPSKVYLTLSGSYDFEFGGSQLQFFGVVNNLLDEEPPIVPGGNGFPTNPVYFDTLGRTYRVGVRMEF